MMACIVVGMINGDERSSATSSQIVYLHVVLLVIDGVTTLIDFNSKNSIGTYARANVYTEQTVS
jgi:hypothetical protein